MIITKYVSVFLFHYLFICNPIYVIRILLGFSFSLGIAVHNVDGAYKLIHIASLCIFLCVLVLILCVNSVLYLN